MLWWPGGCYKCISCYYVVTVLYGNATRNRSIFPASSDWDGIAQAAQMKSPEYLYQANSNIIYFVDDNSCGRSINRESGEVKTHIGKLCIIQWLDN